MVSLRHAFRGSSESTEQATWSRIIVPVTDIGSDTRLLEMACKVAVRQRTDITLVYVVEVAQSMPLDAELPAEVAMGELALKQAREFINRQILDKRSTVVTELLQARSAGAAIVDEAVDRGAELIMLGAKLQRRYGQLTIGETVDYVLRNAPCEVIVVRQKIPDWLIQVLEQDHE